MSRPAIPAKIKRDVLIEAGHRCAIHTCKQTPIEIHHIIPYSECKKHEFKNLIVLCPNCHARVHKNEIDRKALFLYKKILSKSINEKTFISYFNDNIDKKTIEENTKFYEFEFSYPILNDEDTHEINTIIDYTSIKKLHWSRKNFIDDESEDFVTNYFVGSIEIKYINKKFISLKCVDFINSGGAHGYESISTLNYKRDPIVPLYLNDLFKYNSNYLQFISSYSREVLLKKFKDSLNQEWLNKGTAPDENNFKRFILNEVGVQFFFEEYQIMSYAHGSNSILIPYQKIGHLLNQEIIV